MLLSHKTTVKLNRQQSNIVGHMCYAAYKLWNVCNYERIYYKELSLPVDYPDWYYQKKAHKADFWYRQLPSQTAQEVCRLLDKSWKSFHTLLKTHGIENPGQPGFKHEPVAVTYMQMGIRHDAGSDTVRLSLPKQLKGYMKSAYGISDKFIYLKNKIFKSADIIKQIKIYPPQKDECRIIVICEVPDAPELPDNGRYLAVDLGLHNLMTCYDSDGSSFIVGRKYLEYCRYFNKEIARVQSRWAKQQAVHGIRYPETSTHVRRLYQRKSNTMNDYLHKCTRYVVSYCKDHDIHTVVVGDMTGIRVGNDKGAVVNQKMHGLPYRRIYMMLSYKLAMCGIRCIFRPEPYSSQCPPDAGAVSKEYAVKQNRICRGLYVKNGTVWNADSVGAYNILRLYLDGEKKKVPPYAGLSNPVVVKVAV